METKNTVFEPLAYIGTGFTVEARAYSYAGAPAYEIYVTAGSRCFGPVAYYDFDLEADGLEVEYLDVEAIEAAAAAAYRSVNGSEPVDGVGSLELIATRAEIFNSIEVELLAECQSVTPPFEAYLLEDVSFETDRWFIVAETDGSVYVKHKPTCCDTLNAYRLTRGQGGVQIIRVARVWVKSDPLWGVSADSNDLERAFEIELENVFEAAINEWKSRGLIV